MRNFLIEAKPGKPAPSQMHTQLLDQLAFTRDAVQVAYQQDAQEEFRIDRRSAGRAVGIFQFSRTTSKLMSRSLEKLEKRLLEKFNQLTTTLDKILKRLTDFEEEFKFLKEDLKRVKAVIRDKLGVSLD